MTTSSFIYRATVQRDTPAATDVYGQTGVSSFAFHLTLDCRVYSQKRNIIRDGDKDATVVQLRIAYRLNEDIVTGDRITAIKDRNASTLYSATYEIRQPVRKVGHFEADLQEIE